MVNACACGNILLKTKFYNKELRWFVSKAHKDMCKKLKVNKKIYYGKYGYDTYTHVLNDLLIYLSAKGEVNPDKCIEIIHNAWREVYVYWINMKPYMTNDKFIEPKRNINTDANNLLCLIYYTNLDEHRLEIYENIFQTIKSIIEELCLSHKVEQMSLT